MDATAKRPAGWAMTLAYPPSDNECWKPKAIFDKRQNRWMGIIYETHEAKQYKKDVAKRFLAQRPPRFSGDLDVRLRVYRPNRLRDGHNAIAVLLDALQEYVYENDRQVKRLTCERFEDQRNPRVEIEVFPIATAQGVLL